MVQNSNNEKKSGSRMIIDCFKDQKAVSEGHGISMSEINIPVPDKVKRILLEDLIQDDFIRVENDETMWFDQKRWDKTVKELSAKYFLILVIPIIVVTGIVYILSLI